MSNEIAFGVDHEGILISIPNGPNGCYTVITIPPNVADKLVEQWYANIKNEIVTIPRRQSRNRRFSGTIQR
jgi:hypothetical protein